ncbi:transcriptional regulator, XRE family [Olsenella uli DSM 7084]|uniref:alanine transaminase n=1 Tax=Olsenella uli (strain ATCC 49627 / DSM 7084 / CCUG 31166 / CIP 109912 / JCM 12494 / LMG 11480 / NCIMB 702895 / VPI D76D-27C) TaxID=633147 RepID=E1QW00_OLSUV|nr:aminotransferase class I/II-fold pyridoxal phosphate-dependent enzyme [Olsenella uli]ADK68303.1 transcriptional regulator, XRE family [Olsenella uli DSM 7084]
MPQQTFSERLAQRMGERGLKQVDLVHLAQDQGKKLGKSQLSQYVSGKTTPRAETLAFLAQALGVSEEWLLGEASAAIGASGAPGASVAVGVSSDVGDSAPNGSTATIGADTKSRLGAKARPSTRGATQTKGARMREFKKSSKLDNVLYDVRGPVVDEANRMEDEGVHVLKLNIGNPAPFGFRTPDEVVSDMRRQLTECEGYSASRGLFSARKAIMQYDQIKGIPNVQMDDIYTGNGVSELIQLTLNALLDVGDEILIPSPDYPLWTACASLAGGTAVHYLCDEQAHWFPDMTDIRSKITDRTKAIVIINPNNPTGVLYPREVLQEIVGIAREHQLIILADEIYDRLVMDGKEHVSIASLAPDLFCITFNGLSKSHMIAGYRIGWMSISGNKDLGRDLMMGINMLSNMRLCSNVPAQSIVQTALGGHQSVKDYIVPGGRVFEQREFVYSALKEIDGVSVVKPDAAFYIFPRLDPAKFNIQDDERMALDLLRQKHVLIVHGKGFNWQTPGYFRIVYLPRLETLRGAMSNLADFLSYYRQ